MPFFPLRGHLRKEINMKCKNCIFLGYRTHENKDPKTGKLVTVKEQTCCNRLVALSEQLGIDGWDRSEIFEPRNRLDLRIIVYPENECILSPQKSLDSKKGQKNN